jgi:hypothetical protein
MLATDSPRRLNTFSVISPAKGVAYLTTVVGLKGLGKFPLI